MKIFDIYAFSSNGIVAAGQKARSGTMLFIPLLTIALSVVLLTACGGGGGGGNGNGGDNGNGNGDGNGNITDNITDNKMPPDADGDGIADADDAFSGDACASLDTDGDGLPDSLVAGCQSQTNLTADLDDDNDGVEDPADDCPSGDTSWTSNASTDNDGDGCRDATLEDLDDDNDGVRDAASGTTDADNCPLVANADQANTDENADDGGDSDGDACDDDDDNDGVNDFAADGFTQLDACPRGDLDWTSDMTTDNDADGCRDAGEDLDDDNDNVNDDDDNCRLDYNPKQANADGADDGGDACDPDDDNDLILDEMDVDDNNNGLIEIHTLDDLARLRDDLNGNGTDDGNNDTITAVGSVGCPSSGCNGYELTRSLNFSDPNSYAEGSNKMAAWTSGRGWQPIGSCDQNSAHFCNSFYTAMLDGQGWSIADLFINASQNKVGVGLFAVLNGHIQNLHLRNVHIRGGAHSVGTLVGTSGNGRDAHIRNVSVTGGSVMRPGSNRMGGLIGSGTFTDIRYVHVSGVSVSGGIETGGLIGYGSDVVIRYAYVSGVDVVSTNSPAGGLVGNGQSANIRHVYVSGGSVAGSGRVGGLVGQGQPTNIGFAYASGGRVSGGSNVGGLLGSVNDNTIVNASYWNTETTMRSTSATNSTGDVLGMGLTTAQLQGPTDFTGADNIYALWGNFWCDPHTGDELESETKPEDDRFIRVWDLGNSTQYPALRCVPGGLARQRQ